MLRGTLSILTLRLMVAALALPRLRGCFTLTYLHFQQDFDGSPDGVELFLMKPLW